MQLTHFGHAAVLVDTDAGKRALFDPGTYSSGFETLVDLDLILVTHAHPDHLDAERLAALRDANPDATLVGTAETISAAGGGRPGDRQVSGEESFEEAGIRIRATPAAHAPIYPTLPLPTNTGFILDDRVWHPGDALGPEAGQVDVLLLPVGGPWMKVSEAIDFARAVAPRIIVPIHQGGLAEVHRQLHYGLLKSLVPSAELIVLAEGVPREV